MIEQTLISIFNFMKNIHFSLIFLYIIKCIQSFLCKHLINIKETLLDQKEKNFFAIFTNLLKDLFSIEKISNFLKNPNITNSDECCKKD